MFRVDCGWLDCQKEKTGWNVQEIPRTDWNRYGFSSHFCWNSRQEGRLAEGLHLHCLQAQANWRGSWKN